MTTILVTGGSGFIGSHLVRRLVGSHEVTLIVRPGSNLWRIADVVDRCRLVEWDGDARCPNLDPEPDIAVHLATNYVKSHAETDIEPAVRSNVEVPVKLTERLLGQGCDRIVNFGTFFEYDLRHRRAIDENATIHPYNFYAVTKNAFSQFLSFYSMHRGLRAVTLRPFCVYGPFDQTGKLLSMALDHFASGRPMDVTSGEQELDFVHVDDIVDATIRSIELSQDMDPGHQCFNLGSGNPISIRRLLEALARTGGVPCTARWGRRPYADSEIMYARADASKAETILGWRAATDLNTGLDGLWKTWRRGSRGEC